MPTKNPRVLVTLEPTLYKWIRQKAKRQGVSMSLVLRDLVKKESQDEGWYWSEDWQNAEKAAMNDFASGHSQTFESADELFKVLG